MCSTHASAPAAVRGAADRCHAPAYLISPDEVEVYRRAGYQTTYGLGTRPALLIVDVEYNFTGLRGQEHLDSIALYRNSCGPTARDWRRTSSSGASIP